MILLALTPLWMCPSIGELGCGSSSQTEGLNLRLISGSRQRHRRYSVLKLYPHIPIQCVCVGAHSLCYFSSLFSSTFLWWPSGWIFADITQVSWKMSALILCYMICALIDLFVRCSLFSCWRITSQPLIWAFHYLTYKRSVYSSQGGRPPLSLGTICIFFGSEWCFVLRKYLT